MDDFAGWLPVTRELASQFVTTLTCAILFDFSLALSSLSYLLGDWQAQIERGRG